MAALNTDLSSRTNRAMIRSLLPTFADAAMRQLLIAQGSDPARLPADAPALTATITAMLDNLDQAADVQLYAQQPHVMYDFDVNGGAPLPQQIIDDYVANWPTVDLQWDHKDRTRDLRPYPFPSNFMEERRQKGIPDITVGPWADILKKAPNSAALIKADKVAATTQKAVEETYRPFLILLQKLTDAEQAGTQVTVDMLNDAFMTGKCIANASAFCELNRTKQMLAILKPGAEDQYYQPDKQGLMSAEGVASLQRVRDAEKLADKLKLSGSNPRGSRGRGQNSRQRGAAAAGASQSNTAANNNNGGQPSGRGRAKGKGGRKGGRN